MAEPPPAGAPPPQMEILPARERIAAPLPAPLTTLLGRDEDAGRVTTLLDQAEMRLLTLTGPGGVGKTRLAIEVAQMVERDYADGVCFVALAPIPDADLVPLTVATALEIPERADQPLLATLMGALRSRHLLLVLDNVEHLLAEPPTWLTELLGVCPRVKVLVTSRTALNIEGEQQFVVSPLPVPEPGTGLGASDAAALRLFAERARAVRRDVVLDETNLDTVAAICRTLDGLPLAIELAAARIGVLSPDAILSRLTDRFHLLVGRQRDAPARLRSMRDAIAWSYDLLTPEEQQFFQRLSVFVGGFTLGAAEAVCGTGEHPAMDALTGMTSLVDHSLLGRVDTERGESRYAMLETIREFAAEQLAASGEDRELRQRHAMWFLEFAATDNSAFHPFRHVARVERLEADHANLRAALAWLDDSGQEAELAELVARLRWLWYLNAHWSEGMFWYQRVLQSPHGHPATLRCDLARGAGQIAHFGGSDADRGYLEQALAIAQAIGDEGREVEALFHLALIDEDTGRYADADVMFRRARDHFERAGNPWARIACDYHLGVVAYGMGDLAVARRRIEEAMTSAIDVGDHLIPLWARPYLILIACDRGEVDRALALLSEQRRDESSGIRDFFTATAGVVAATRGHHALAARLLGAAAVLRHDIPMELPERVAIDRAAERASRQLGHDAFDIAWAEGRRLRPADVDAEIGRLLTGSTTTAASSVSVKRLDAGLTERETEVLRLLADGLTNAQIAEQLYISRRTAATHIRHIFDKLDVTSRAAAAAFAIRAGLA